MSATGILDTRIRDIPIGAIGITRMAGMVIITDELSGFVKYNRLTAGSPHFQPQPGAASLS